MLVKAILALLVICASSQAPASCGGEYFGNANASISQAYTFPLNDTQDVWFYVYNSTDTPISVQLSIDGVQFDTFGNCFPTCPPHIKTLAEGNHYLSLTGTGAYFTFYIACYDNSNNGSAVPTNPTGNQTVSPSPTPSLAPSAPASCSGTYFGNANAAISQAYTFPLNDTQDVWFYISNSTLTPISVQLSIDGVQFDTFGNCFPTCPPHIKTLAEGNHYLSLTGTGAYFTFYIACYDHSDNSSAAPTNPTGNPTASPSPTPSPAPPGGWIQLGNAPLTADGLPGASVAFSGAGDLLAAAGTPGAVWIFAPTDSTRTKWIEQTKLVDPISGTNSLTTVALSSDGNLLVSGGSQYVVIWTRGGDSKTWNYQTRNYVCCGNWGYLQVALNGKGDILAVGASAGVGSVVMFTSLSPNSWTQQQVLNASDAVGEANQGDGVALNAAGDILAFSGHGDNNNAGAVWIFTRDTKSGLWSEESKLLGSGSLAGIRYIMSVDLSAAGDILAFSGFGTDAYLGAAWVFERNNNTTPAQWSELARLQLPSEAVNMMQGFAISLSGDGEVLASTVERTTGQGYCCTPETWIFERSAAGSWSSSAAPIRIRSVGDTFNQGYSVALSTTGDLLANGAWNPPSSGGVLMFQKEIQSTPSPNPTSAPGPKPTSAPTSSAATRLEKMSSKTFYSLVIILPILGALGVI